MFNNVTNIFYNLFVITLKLLTRKLQSKLLFPFFFTLFSSNTLSHCWDNIQLVTPHQKYEVLLAKNAITEWAMDTLREHVRQSKLWAKSTSSKIQFNSSRKLCWAR